jgi:hypothetical protein
MCILTMDQEIPNRYVLLNKDQVKDFKEDQLEFLLQKFIRSFKRQMTVYYNILNILGDHAKKIQMQLLLCRFIRTRTSRWFSNVRIN